jgi:tRNA uridine 5-carboxymethylaminomethyl modification enzyme
LASFDPSCISTEPEIAEQVEIQIKYAGYIQRQEEQVARLKKLEGMRLPIEVNYKNIQGLSTEVKEKLSRIRPLSIGQASRISGITPAALSILMVYLRKLDHTGKNLE